MNVGDRIKLRRKEIGMSQTDLANEVGSTKQNIYKYENGIITNIPSDKVEAISAALCTTPAYLMGWDDTADSHDSDSDAGLCYVQYAGPVAAHFDATPTEEHEFRRLPPEWLGHRRPEDFFVASVDGNSMYPHFHHGDEILCLRCSDMGHSGRVGIIVFGNDKATLKRIDYQPGEDWIDLVPVNPEYQTKRIKGADLEQCRVVGRVIKVIRTVDEA